MNEDYWYIVQLKGFCRRAGQMQETEWAGTKWVRIDMPINSDGNDWESDGNDWDIEYFHPSVIYSFRQVSEAEARREAQDIIEGV